MMETVSVKIIKDWLSSEKPSIDKGQGVFLTEDVYSDETIKVSVIEFKEEDVKHYSEGSPRQFSFSSSMKPSRLYCDTGRITVTIGDQMPRLLNTGEFEDIPKEVPCVLSLPERGACKLALIESKI